MAIEIALEGYLFAPDEALKPAGTDEELEDTDEELEDKDPKLEDANKELEDKRKKPVRYLLHNPLHDIESIWWVALWSIVSYSVEAASGNYNANKRHISYLKMFSETMDESERLRFMIGFGFTNAIQSTFPSEFEKILWHLDSLRRVLLRSYKEAYAPFTSPWAKANTAPFDLSHAEAIEYLRLIRTCIDSLYFSDKVITLQNAVDSIRKL
jgi:hypothetical protein